MLAPLAGTISLNVPITNFQPAGDLAVGIFEPPCPAALMVELGGEPVALGGEPVAFVGERAELLFELRRLVPIFEKLAKNRSRPSTATPNRTKAFCRASVWVIAKPSPCRPRRGFPAGRHTLPRLGDCVTMW